jgi:hypothetical protein
MFGTIFRFVLRLFRVGYPILPAVPASKAATQQHFTPSTTVRQIFVEIKA